MGKNKKIIKWEATLWMRSQHYNQYVGTFDTEVEAAAASDAYIRERGVENAKLSFESAEAAAAAVEAVTAA